MGVKDTSVGRLKSQNLLGLRYPHLVGQYFALGQTFQRLFLLCQLGVTVGQHSLGPRQRNHGSPSISAMNSTFSPMCNTRTVNRLDCPSAFA